MSLLEEPMTDEIKSIHCPSCGAPLQVEEDQTLVKCQYCGAQASITKKPEIGQLITTLFPPPPVSSNATRGFVLIAVVLVLVIGIVMAVISSVVVESVSQGVEITPGVKVWSIYSVYMAPSAGSDQPDAALLTYNSDETYRLLWVDWQAEQKPAWTSAPISSELSELNLAVTAENIYLAQGTRLTAYNRASGAVLWEASLSDFVSCEGCLQQTGDRVVALNKSGEVQAFDAQTGKSAWSVSLKETPDRLFILDGKPAVFDREDEVLLKVFDPRNGSLAFEIKPLCPNDVFDGDLQSPDLYSTAWLSADGKAIYFLYGFFTPACLERWNGTSGQREWQALMSEEWGRGYNLSRIQSDGVIYLALDGEVTSVVEASQEVRPLASVEDYTLSLVGASQDVLVLTARRNRGTVRWELWGLDAKTGTRLWQYVLESGEPLDKFASIINDNGEFTAHLVSGGVGVAQVYEDPDRLTFNVLDLKTGVSGEMKVYSLPETSIVTMGVQGWVGDVVWLKDDAVYVMDVLSGEALYSFP
jgi:outer membrane protein assembly factor BamB/predicted RNA-binding Zn-ribbon protein involved in translation (DUF1610 family)